MKDKPPTEFEFGVLKMIGAGNLIAGNKRISLIAAAKRLERKHLVYAASSSKWRLTPKGYAALNGK